MEAFLIYIGKSALAAGAFYLVYLALFQSQKQFTFNRIYLPVSLALSFFIPLITLTTVNYVEPLPVEANPFPALTESPEPVVMQQSRSQFIWEWYHYLFAIYAAGTALFLFRLLLGHGKAWNIIRKSRVQELFSRLVNISKNDIHPFSFFNKIVLSENTLSHPNLNIIVAHENIHVKEKHTLDILFTEILFLLQWFNPFAWLLKDAVKNNLEYKTDDQITKTTDVQTYQFAMVALVEKQGVAPFLTALNGSQLKNRIIMMKKRSRNKFGWLKQLVVLPLLAVLVMGLAEREVKTEFIQHENQLEAFASIPESNIKELNTEKELNKFLISIEFRQNQFVLEGLEGCAFRELKFSAIDNKPVAINRFGMTSEKTGNSQNNPGFLFEIEKTNDQIILTGKDGTNWKELSYHPASEKWYISEKGVSRVNEPLIVVDGSITNYKSVEEIDPGNIQSITVLKDKRAIEHYGEMAKNGVVLISTNNSEDGITISGKVTDQKGNPIESATVTVKGRNFGVVTNKDGEYTMEVQKTDEVLVYGYLYHEKIEIEIGGQKRIDVQLNTGEEPPFSGNPWQSSFRMRNSAGELVKPLYLVDGKEGNIENINRHFIESRKLLNDKQATEIYGEKGKNGVVLITLKNPDEMVNIHGIVTNENGELLGGSSIVEYDELGRVVDGTKTDRTGSYQYIIKRENSTIRCNHLFYKSQVLDVKGSGRIDIQLERKMEEDTTGRSLPISERVLDKRNLTGDSTTRAENSEKYYLDPSETVYNVVGVMPEFPGGEIALRMFIAKSIRYPVKAQQAGIQGKVYVSFVINKDGNVANAMVMKGVEDSLDEEALRVIHSLPAWKPGKHEGKAVSVSYTVPISFLLQD